MGITNTKKPQFNKYGKLVKVPSIKPRCEKCGRAVALNNGLCMGCAGIIYPLDTVGNIH